jgi:ABC-type uncharacterized transport system substrate-binding protein
MGSRLPQVIAGPPKSEPLHHCYGGCSWPIRIARWAQTTQRLAIAHRVAAFVQRLRELRWAEGRIVAIEYRWGEGRAERYAELAAEFIQLKVDVVLAAGTEPAVAAKQATSVFPIVFSTAGDQLGTGLVASLARPG